MTFHSFAACSTTLGLTQAQVARYREHAPWLALEAETPSRVVKLAAFALAIAPVTHLEYRAFVDEGGYDKAEYWEEDDELLETFGGLDSLVDLSGAPGPLTWEDGAPPSGQEQHPVHGVSWFEARAYARFVGHRLPNEAEWEYAARGSEGRLFPWTSSWAELEPKTCPCVCEAEGTAPVQALPAGATPEGIMHLSGNVAPWCADDFDDGSDLPLKVVRGDFFRAARIHMRATARQGHPPILRSPGFGFRLAKSIPSSSLSSS